ncbi:MAG: hypothetical protein RL040_198 [Bacteroidota bacterium]|jgi:hypothetical protein
MKKDLDIEEVSGVYIAFLPNRDNWSVYIINNRKEPLETVIVNASGEGKLEGKEKQTATLRFLLNDVPAESVKPFELLMPDSLKLSHRYWVSYYIGNRIFDKKFVYTPDMYEDDLQDLPVFGSPGILLT